MNKLINIIVFFLLLAPVNASSADFPWTMFLPGIIGNHSGISPKVTCEDIAGCYEGAFTDNCPGTVVTGRMYLAMNSDCSFSSFSNSGVQATGSITGRNGSIYTGSGTTDSNGCGAFSLTCSDTGSSVSCNYTYSTGKTGSIPNASPVACKPLNRLKTEMLAGSWRFTYQIGISTFTNDYYLNINDVQASTSITGQYDIYGEGQWGDPVIAGYVLSLGKYDLYDPGSIINRYYSFSFIGNGLVSGCYYQIDSSTGSWSSCYPMSGTLISLAKSASLTDKLEQISEEQKGTKVGQEVNELEAGRVTIKISDKNNLLLDDYKRLKEALDEKQ